MSFRTVCPNVLACAVLIGGALVDGVWQQPPAPTRASNNSVATTPARRAGVADETLAHVSPRRGNARATSRSHLLDGEHTTTRALP